MFVTLKHEATGAETTQPETTARALRKRGWVDVDSSAPAALTAPAKSAPKGEWVDYAIARGADPADAEASTRDALIDTYGD